jgi:hypothetical protein
MEDPTWQNHSSFMTTKEDPPSLIFGQPIRLSSLEAGVIVGPGGLKQVLEHNLVQPTALASADFDEDGVPDLVSGYAGPGGGILTLRRGNLYALYPHADRASMSQRVNESMDSSVHLPIDSLTHLRFLPEARVFEVSEAPEFIGAGDFDADGHWDVAAAARGSRSLHLLRGDGRGGFGESEVIALPGVVTALVVGEINRRDGLDDVIIAVNGAKGPQALVFEGPNGAFGYAERRVQPEMFPLPAEATVLALGQLDQDSGMDLAIAAQSELMVIHGRDRQLSAPQIRQAAVPPAMIEQRSFAFAITSLALGDFVRDNEHRTDIALLADDGSVHVLTNANHSAIVTGGPTELRSRLRRSKDLLARGAKVIDRHTAVQVESKPLDEWPGEILTVSPLSQATQLVRAKMSSLPTDDLVVLGGDKGHLSILTSGEGIGNRSSIRNPKSEIRISQAAPIAVLPMRLNKDALDDLVILAEGTSTPTVALTAPGAIITVNWDADTIGRDSVMTLREAIHIANGTLAVSSLTAQEKTQVSGTPAAGGLDEIRFNIGPSRGKMIVLGSALPKITEPVTIDGTTQPGFSRVPRIILNGSQFGGDGLTITAGNSVVRGLVINRFFNGILLQKNGGNIIEGNFLGADGTGTLALGNGAGVQIENAPNNMIGGTTASARNVISGNDEDGVYIYGVGNRNGTVGNKVQGNFIGTDLTGTKYLGNALTGIYSLAASNTLIGGTVAGARNIISGNDSPSRSYGGIEIDDVGVGIEGALVQGNYIGTDVTGAKIVRNPIGILTLQAATTIGGTTPSARNVISGNLLGVGLGIGFPGTPGLATLLQGNFIGTDVTGTADLGNRAAGVFIGSPGNMIGGERESAPGAGNIIAFNGGIALGNNVFNVAGGVLGLSNSGNLILSNSIFSNVGLGIDLESDGVTPNDPGDFDRGSNNLQNFPVLTSVSGAGGNMTVQGTLNSTPRAVFRLEFFSNPGCDPSGLGEGQTYLGAATVMSDEKGDVDFTGNKAITFPVTMSAGSIITATATEVTNRGGNTSEFSAPPVACPTSSPDPAIRSTNSIESPDIWVDSRMNGVRIYPPNQPVDTDGAPQGPGDPPWGGHENFIHFRLRNLGTGEARNVQVRVFVRQPLGITALCVPRLTAQAVELKDPNDLLQIPSLAPGQVFVGRVTWEPTSSLPAQIEVQIVPQPSEVSTANNSARQVVHFVESLTSGVRAYVRELALLDPLCRSFFSIRPIEPIPQDWDVLYPLDPIILDRGQMNNVTITVTRPRSARAGDMGVIPMGVFQRVGSMEYLIGGLKLYSMVVDPATIQLTAPTEVQPGRSVTITGSTSPMAPQKTLALEYRFSPPSGPSQFMIKYVQTDARGAFRDTFVPIDPPKPGLLTVQAYCQTDGMIQTAMSQLRSLGVGCQRPTIRCPSFTVLQADATCTAKYGDDANEKATATSVCVPPEQITITGNPSLPAMLPVGNHTVTFTAEDPFRNRSTCTTTVTVNAWSGNLSPTANAGLDQFISSDSFPVTATLNGTAGDPNPGQTLTCRWTQVGGPAATINSPNSCTTTVSAPFAPLGVTFRLTVSDPCGRIATDEVVVTTNFP